mgnify:FL=1
MSRIPTPATLDVSPAASQPLLQTVQASLGSVPNLFRLLGNSPATLEGYLQLNGALDEGELEPATRERIALAVAEVNQCHYCLAAHTYLGKHVAKLTDTEILANRHGSSGDHQAEVAVKFAVLLVQRRGDVSRADVETVLAAGYSHAQLLEIIAHVALTTLTNYVNRALDTEIDFPPIKAL